MLRILPTLRAFAALVALLSCTGLLAQTSEGLRTKTLLSGLNFTFSGQFPSLDLLDAKNPRLGLHGASTLTIPTSRTPTRVLRFGYTADGWRSNLKVGDDRDPQHGFAPMLEIDGAGRIKLAGCASIARLVPARYYVFELRWSWSTSGLRIEQLRFAPVSFATHTATILKSTETRKGERGVALRMMHSGSGRCWLDRLSVTEK